MSNDLQLTISGLNLRYPGCQENALNDLSVASRGSRIGIIGPSHAGKSSLLALLAGIVPQMIPAKVAGAVSLAGQDLTTWRKRHDLAMVQQDPVSQLTGLADTVYDELAFSLLNQGKSDAEIDQAVQLAADQLDLTGLLACSPNQLSGGQVQRVAIASALAAGPDLLLLDDASSQMDPLGREHFFSWLKKLPCPLLIVSGEVDDLAELCDQIWVMKDGRLVMAAAPQQVFNALNDPAFDKPVAWKMARKLGLELGGRWPVTANELKKAAINANRN